MSHNKIFVSNLNRLLKINKDLFFGEIIYSSEKYLFFIKELANKFFESAGLEQIELPILDCWADKGVSTKYGVLITQFDPMFVKENQDAHFFAIAVDENANYKVFSLEVVNANQEIQTFEFCEYDESGNRNVIKSNLSLSLYAFGSAIYDVLK